MARANRKIVEVASEVESLVETPEVTQTETTSSNVIPLVTTPPAKPTSTPVVIEENIPLPEATKATTRKSKYPWHDLKPGNSFFAESVKLNSFKTLCNFHTKKHENETNEELRKIFECRQVNNEAGEPIGVRVWRTK